MRIDPWEAAHRSALDHVLGLIAESSWADVLMLRGSMLMPAWVGEQARLPGDLDWIVLSDGLTLPDRRAPWPFVDTIDPAQHWPEAVHGGARNEMWTFEEFETGGQHPRLPPEGLHWMGAEQLTETGYTVGFVRDMVTDSPRTEEGVEFDLDAILEIDSVDYYSDDGEYGVMEPGRGIRTTIELPWVTPGGEGGKVNIDFAFDEVVPEPPVLTAVPRADGRSPLGLLTASRELSLAWKLHWLAADQSTQRVSAAKDLYDAVLLAEVPGIRLPERLQPFALDELVTLLTLPTWSIEGDLPGGAAPWLARLAAALPALQA
ncbi:nucleotidyl transferase AbiEii/AbiGii toxin family protein [Actinoplanes sp. NPDC020271]|uniref:nucleotidyl transferase AbiEii/AbiGii toxin family protein n=1 Tax=Actinoplanes sp. NPDC020271 TaxID=3363896 RepID=UPI0037961019